ncbi:hypothetical protein CXF79_19225 [Colwellia sp. Bg11-28]|nr:hypothetical protein CXF79_19225 [Colwellia sp. Bg11-28]
MILCFFMLYLVIYQSIYLYQSDELSNIFKWPNYPITSLLSIPIVSYYSIKRLVIEKLFSLLMWH